MHRALPLILLSASSCVLAGEDTPNCSRADQFDVEKLRARELRVVALPKKAQQNVMRYLDRTQGNPPDLSKWPGYQIYLVHQTTGAFIDHGRYVTPPASGTIAITKSNCVMYKIYGRADSMIRIANGTWTNADM